jgi:transposase
MARPSNYSPELRVRAVRMVAELTPDYPSQYAAITAVAKKLGIGTAETLRKWVRRAEVDAGQRPGTTSAEHAEIRRLKREVAELRRANEILKAASASSRPSWTGPRPGDRVHPRAQGPPRWWPAVGCRADLRRAE